MIHSLIQPHDVVLNQLDFTLTIIFSCIFYVICVNISKAEKCLINNSATYILYAVYLTSVTLLKLQAARQTTVFHNKKYISKIIYL